MDKQLIRELAAEMGVSPQTLDPLRRMAFEQAAQRLRELKEAAKLAYKQLAFKYHPDRNREDPETATLRFKALIPALEAINALRVNRPQPVVMQTMRWTFYPQQSTEQVVQFHTRGGGTQTSTVSGVRRRPYDATRVVFIRVD